MINPANSSRRVWIELNTFSVIVGLGTVLGLGWMAWELVPRKALAILDASVWVLMGALVGGRAAFVTGSWAYFQSHPAEIFQFWLGGLSASGALWGAVLALFPAARLVHQRPGELANALLRPGLVLAASAWLGVWLSGVAYGQPVPLGLPAPDEWGQIQVRFPTQLLGALLALGLLGLLDPLRKRRPLGLAAVLGFLGLSVSLVGLSFLRADPALLWRGWRVDTWGGLSASGLGLLILMGMVFVRWRERALEKEMTPSP